MADGTDTPIDFNTFVLSLSTSALNHLGVVKGETVGSTPEVQLAMAKQTIDILAMLDEKTRGNLDGEEERLLHRVLEELRLEFDKKRK
ncbi:MAG: DUF1844 domain-containing protein [Myxococcota bacterium]